MISIIVYYEVCDVDIKNVLKCSDINLIVQRTPCSQVNGLLVGSWTPKVRILFSPIFFILQTMDSKLVKITIPSPSKNGLHIKYFTCQRDPGGLCILVRSSSRTTPAPLFPVSSAPTGPPFCLVNKTDGSRKEHRGLLQLSCITHYLFVYAYIVLFYKQQRPYH